MIRFYFKTGHWRVTSNKTIVNARDWWNAINQVKCMNHKLRAAKSKPHTGAAMTGPQDYCSAGPSLPLSKQCSTTKDV